MKQTTISNVNAGFELLVEELGYAVDEIPPSGIGARRAVSCCREKIAEILDCWKAIVSIHHLDDGVGEPEAEVKADEPVTMHEKIDREHSHWGYDPCPLRVVIDGKDLLADDADGIGTHKRNAWKLFVQTARGQQPDSQDEERILRQHQPQQLGQEGIPQHHFQASWDERRMHHSEPRRFKMVETAGLA